jgi:hypothetical protein
MNGLLAGTPVLALVLGAGIAQADQVVGSVQRYPIDIPDVRAA